MLRSLPLAAALVLATLLARFQDPQPSPAPPAPAPAAPPVATVPGAEVAKPVPGRPTKNAIEGVYELRARVIDGKRATVPSRGWLAITQRHLFLCLSAPGTDPDAPLLRAGVRTWHTEREQGYVRTTVQLGWFTDAAGTIHLEPTGTDERRRIELIHGGVRVAQDDNNFLEFERVE